MKPHPRIRKTIKWGGTTLTLLLVVVWIDSRTSHYWWGASSGPWIGIEEGAVELGYLRRDPKHIEANVVALYSRLARPDAFAWVPLRGGAAVRFPLWLPALLSLGVTSIVWRLDTLARRRARLNLCPKCNYDRAGLAADARCPECGEMPAKG